jgi:hypothetical protein
LGPLTIGIVGKPWGRATVNQHPPVHHQGWMICDQKTVFCWVPVPGGVGFNEMIFKNFRLRVQEILNFEFFFGVIGNSIKF